jgi:hypothetical protein
LVHVDAAPPDWPHDTGMLSVMTHVGVAGEWPTTIDIRCIASGENPASVLGPWMKGRDKVPFQRLIEELQATLNEREQVIEMAESGIAGPYVFETAVWKNVDLLEGFDPF